MMKIKVKINSRNITITAVALLLIAASNATHASAIEASVSYRFLL